MSTQQNMPGDWTVEWDAYSPPGTIRLNSRKWGGCFLRPPEPHDIGLHALAYRLLRDSLATSDECKTCGGSRVDPGGLPACRDCTPGGGLAAAHMNQTAAQPEIDYSIVSAYADKHRLHFKGLCDMVQSACGAR